jgi:serine/threonine-protein kinase
MPDGKHLVFRSSPSPEQNGIAWIRADGAREPQRLLEGKILTIPTSFSPDGRRLAYFDLSPETAGDIWTLPLDLSDPEHPKPGKPEPFLSTPAREIRPAFSPDGRWIAYQSDESGRYEVSVRPFPGPGGKRQVSAGGGANPIWSRDGRQLFFTSLDNRIMVASAMVEGESFLSGKPLLWSPAQIRQPSAAMFLDLAPDGKRFAVFPMPEAKPEEKGSVHVTFLLNFFDEVRRRAPVSAGLK